jgi:hypothetical protein
LEFPNTAYYLPVIYGMLGIKVEKLGDMEQVLKKCKGILPPPVREDHPLPYLAPALDAGMATFFAEECIEAIRYLEQPDFYLRGEDITDTNIWLEIFMKQRRSFEAKNFLRQAEKETIFLTDFSLYSIGISLFDSKQFETFLKFAEDIMVRGAVGLIRNEMMDLEKMALVLRSLDCNHALVVHGEDGLDEVTITKKTQVCELKDGSIKNYFISACHTDS